MTVPAGSVRGVGRSRGGATDTTMLVWKVIAADPGITFDEIWERVEHGIPEGYALRRYSTSAHGKTIIRRGGLSSDNDLGRARRWVLRNRLWEMCRNKSIEHDGDGYRTLRDISYKGNADAIDETGTKAAGHMALADALRLIDKAIARANPNTVHGPFITIRRGREADALLRIIAAVRNT